MTGDRLRASAVVSRSWATAEHDPGVRAVWEALADLLEAEAEYIKVMQAQGAALNFLISTSEGDADHRWRVKVGYATTPQASAVADAILGGES